ncbi:MAG TPA: hypothetical protein DDW20_05005 [Firmicutes bacterium]|nr:hypothetical protein [Bacillota bacterium]
MNVLTDKFPTKIKVNNKVLKINSDFRNCIKIIEAFEDDDLFDEEKYLILIRRLYIDEVKEEDLEQAIIKGIKFLDLGEENENNEENVKRLYSFSKDDSYIYTGIRQSHNIDLNSIEYLHWWNFVYLFLDIGQDCMFNQLVYYRKRKNEGKLTKDEKKVYISMRKILDLDYEEENEEDDEFMRQLNNS